MTAGSCMVSPDMAVLPQKPRVSDLGWESESKLPTVLKEAQGLAVDTKLFVFGGFEGGGFTIMGNLSLSYDPTTSTWTQLADVPVNGGVSHSGQTTDGENIYLVGGMQVNVVQAILVDVNMRHIKLSSDNFAVSSWNGLIL